MAKITQWMGETPIRLQRELQTDTRAAMRLRRGVIGASLVGIASMACTTLLQMGMVRNLPDPPLGNFQTKKVNSSAQAYSYGGPDSPVTILAHAMNIVIAATGSPARARRQPWLPVVATVLAAGETAVAGQNLFRQMPKVDKAWCAYCIADALTHFATLAMTIPESIQALTWTVRGRPVPRIPAYYTTPPLRPRVTVGW